MAGTRPRGFKDWNPQPATAQLIVQVEEILNANSDILPLTLRQIFYMLVSGYNYDKTEKAYNRLTEAMNRARRAQLVAMDAIRDDGFREHQTTEWDNYDDIVGYFKTLADQFELKRQEVQPTYLMIWCEAQGMMPQLASAVRDWHVPVLSSGGFDSTTTKHDVAVGISNHDAVEILHIGDHDPSGVHIHSSLDEDLQAFVGYYGGDLKVTRLAVTPDQVDEMDLPTAPPKSTDKRSFDGYETTQAEAIPPRTLRAIVQEAVESRTDMNAFNAAKALEAPIRQRLLAGIERMEGQI